MTEALFRAAPYRGSAPAHVVRVTEDGGIVLDRTVFYPTGGGQPGDSGTLCWGDTEVKITTTVKGEGDDIVLVPEEGKAEPSDGVAAEQALDWPRRFAHMRLHTALHLLSVVIPLPVTGGAIGNGKGRLDFRMPEPPKDRDAIEAALNALVDADQPVTEHWISEEALDAQPDLVKTLSVQPPRGAGRIRLVRIGPEDTPVDLQPCGGTHVARTSEIGRLRLGKIENKGAQNRRVSVHLCE